MKSIYLFSTITFHSIFTILVISGCTMPPAGNNNNNTNGNDNCNDTTNPTASAGADQTVNDNVIVTLDGSGSTDPNSSPLLFAWSQTGGPEVTIMNASSQRATFMPSDVTEDTMLRFRLIVTNSDGCTSFDIININVQDAGDTSSCVNVDCPDDGMFCNGTETCVNGICTSSGNPCMTGQSCDENTDSCIASCPVEINGTGIFTITQTSAGTTNYFVSPIYTVTFSNALNPDTFTGDEVTVWEAGPDNSLGSSDDVQLSPDVSLLNNRTQISINFTPGQESLIAGRRYRVQIDPGCLRVQDDLGNNVPLDGEFNGTFPTGDGQQGGNFVQDFIGIEQREFATNTNGIRALAVRGSDGALFGVGSNGTFGPISFGTNQFDEDTRIAPLVTGINDDVSLGITSTGLELIVARLAESGTAFNLQRVNVNTGENTTEEVTGSLPYHLRLVPDGINSAVFPSRTLIGTSNLYTRSPIQVLDLSTTPAMFMEIESNYVVHGFNFNTDNQIFTPGVFLNSGIEAAIGMVASTGTFTALIEERELGPDNATFVIGTTAPLPDGSLLNVNGTDDIEIFPQQAGGQIMRFVDYFANDPTDLVVSPDLNSMYISLPQSNSIIELRGFNEQ